MDWRDRITSRDEALRIERGIDQLAGVAKAEALVQLARHYCPSRPNQALTFATAALTEAREIRDASLESYALMAIGIVYLDLGEHLTASTCLSQSLERATDPSLRAAILVNLGSLQMQAGLAEEALHFFDQAVEFKRDAPPEERAGFIVNRAVALRFLGRYDEALREMDEVLAIEDRLPRPDVVGACYNNKGGLLRQIGKHSVALDAFQRSLDVAKSLDEEKNVAGILTNIGAVHLEMGKIEEARTALSEALRRARSVDAPGLIAGALEVCRKFYRETGETEKALECSDELEAIRSEMLQREQRSAAKRAQDSALRQESHRGAAARLSDLTPRELEVVDLLVKGRANKQIGRALDISPRTVEKHRAAVMQKAGVETFAELLQVVIHAKGA